MPPKRKRAEADSAVESSTTRSGKKPSRTTREKNGMAGATGNAGASNAAEPPPKKTRGKGKTNTAAARATKAGSQAFAIDDEPLNSTTSQQQRDDELVMPKQVPSTISRVEYTQQGAEAVFKSFADDDDPDVIGPGGVEKLCTEAGIHLEGAQPLLLAWQFKTREMAKISRSEWLQGTEALRISSLPVLAIALKELDDLVVRNKEPMTPAPSLSSVKKRDAINPRELYNRTRYSQYALNRNAAFTELYQFCFTLAKPPQSRNLDIETAIALWSVLLASRYPIIMQLADFLNEIGTYKGANKDIWNMVHEFCQTIDGEFSNYETDGAWPTMLDDFVKWKKDRVAPSGDDTPR